MGYAVYEDGDRWAGYGVPAECDVADCHAEIDRGLAFKCETFIEYRYERNGIEFQMPEGQTWLPEDAEEIEDEREGCGMFFCDEHQDHSTHEGATPKPDSVEWLRHMRTHESWQQWRDNFPDQVAAIDDRIEKEANRG